MRVDVKVCGLTRADDARYAAELGASYVGVIFAGGPRNIDPMRARDVLDGAGSGISRVGVFGAGAASDVARTVREARLDIVQLHADPTVAEVESVREATGARVWAVVRVGDDVDPDALEALWNAADALVLDSRVRGVLGGSGRSFDWRAAEASTRGHGAALVVAGGLTAANVVEAIETLSPTIVDVSSGVESAPGIKDHNRMAGFMGAVRRAGVHR